MADFSASMPSIIRRRRRRRKVVLFEAVLAPLQQVAAAPQPQRDLVAFGVLLQHPQIELHQVPADDGVGIVALQPRVQPFQQLGRLTQYSRSKSSGASPPLAGPSM